MSEKTSASAASGVDGEITGTAGVMKEFMMILPNVGPDELVVKSKTGEQVKLPKGELEVTKVIRPKGHTGGAIQGKRYVKRQPVSGRLTGKSSSGSAFRRAAENRAPRKLDHFEERTNFVISALGNATLVAELLDVSRSQPGKWKTGAEAPSPEKSSLLIDLDYVLAKATLVWEPEVARQWLVGSEPFLDFARPIDVLRTRGASEVVEALDSVLAGAYS